MARARSTSRFSSSNLANATKYSDTVKQNFLSKKPFSIKCKAQNLLPRLRDIRDSFRARHAHWQSRPASAQSEPTSSTHPPCKKRMSNDEHRFLSLGHIHTHLGMNHNVFSENLSRAIDFPESRLKLDVGVPSNLFRLPLEPPLKHQSTSAVVSDRFC